MSAIVMVHHSDLIQIVTLELGDNRHSPTIGEELAPLLAASHWVNIVEGCHIRKVEIRVRQ